MRETLHLTLDDAPPIVLLPTHIGKPTTCFVAAEPVTAEQWESLSPKECFSNCGFATKVSWGEAIEFCRAISNHNRPMLDILGAKVAVSLPTYQLWEEFLLSNLPCLKVRAVPHWDIAEGCVHELLSINEEPHIKYVCGLKEMCLDFSDSDYTSTDIGTVLEPTNDGADTYKYKSISGSPDRRLKKNSSIMTGSVSARTRDTRWVWIEAKTSRLKIGRGYTLAGHDQLVLPRREVGFRVAVHPIAPD